MSSPTPSSHAPLVGRDRELGILHDQLAAARAGTGTLVLISGAAGIGKTALATALCRAAQGHGMLVLVGRCYDLTETPPYGPWLDLFARYHPGDGSPLGSMPPPPLAFAERGSIGAVPSQAALFQQVHDFFAALCTGRPVVLLLDDLHWADPATLDLLRVLARALPALPLLLLVTYRADELLPAHPLTRLLPTLVREAPVERIDLRPLRADDTATLVAERYHLTEESTARLATYTHGRSEGNPLFVGELLRTLEEEQVLQRTTAGWTLGFLVHVRVPPLLRQIIEGRAARLNAEARRLLAIAAVIGQEVPLSIWASVASEAEEGVLSVLEQATAARLTEMTADGMALRFVHALIREVLYEGLSPPVRRLVHCTAGEVLAERRAPDPDAVASHFQRADDERAVPWLLQAGERAQAAYARTTAAARFEAALALMERTDSDVGERGWLLLRLSRLLQFVEVAKARAFVDAAFPLAQAANDRSLAAFAQFQRGLLASFAGNVMDGLPALEEAAAAMAALTDAERAHFTSHAAAIADGSRIPEGRGGVVLWRAYTGRYREARALGEQLVAEAAGGDEDMLQALREGFGGLGDAYAALGMPDEAEVIYAIARQAFVRAGHHVLAANTAMRELDMVALPYRTENIATRRLAEWAVAERERASGAVPASIPPRVVCLSLLVLEGEWEEAEHLTLTGSAEARATIGFRTSALRHLAALARLRGDAERAQQVVREWLPAGPATAPGTFATFDVATAMQRVAAALAMDEGDLSTAKEWLVAHDRWLDWSGAVLGQSEGQVLWARYHRQIGDVDQAREHAERALTYATAPRQPLALLAAHRLLGELDTDAGRADDARDHLALSLALANACAAPFERALTLLALVELHAARGEHAQARDLLDAARAICLPLNAGPTLARIDALAQRLVATKMTAPAHPAGLTAREVEVLRLISAGLTNPQAAARLFLSPRTVGQHLRSIYHKLGVSTRAAATRFAVENHLS